MIVFYRILYFTTAIMLSETHFKTTPKSSAKFPKLTEFFKKKPEFKRRCKLSQCDVDIHKEQCIYRTFPRKPHCLVLKNLVTDLIPQYKPVLNRTELRNFKMLAVTELYVNTCTRKVTFKTSAEGKFVVVPDAVVMTSVEAGISIPIPLGDFQLVGAGEWIFQDIEMKVKFSKEWYDQYSIKGYSVIDLFPIERIREIFDIDILPKGPISVILQNINVDTIKLKQCKLYGFIQPNRQTYELAFSGEPSKKEFSGGHIHVFITKVGTKKNLAVLLELQDYSPVTLLKKMYGASISRVNVLRDRNQTIALYISGLSTEKFSSTFTSHGSSRWIHRESIFEPGAYLLVTLAFPKRKALDMKIQLFPDGLGFSLPENEKLSGDLALGAISPEKIMHVGVDKSASHKDKNNKMYSKIRILKFKYFLFNDTYLAAAESHLSPEEELEELMPLGRPDLLNDSNRNYYKFTKEDEKKKKIDKNKLDSFFKREENDDDTKRELDDKESNSDPLSLAESIGLL